VKVELTLNGSAAALDVRTDEMLMEVLRREGLLSVRATCGIGMCGACTVLVDDEPVSGCLMLAAQAAGALADAHGFQCGWCTPGFVLAAKRMLELADGEPLTDEAIAAGLGGNLCRCGSYLKIAEGVRRCAS
jgi:aerobic-type carbon monoxide dehydrogenase small subunit (CoxS/CutS family)